MDAVFKAKHRRTSSSQLHRFFGEVDGSYLGACASKVDGICADAAADFQDFFSLPVSKIGKTRDVILHEIFAGFDLIKVFLVTDRSSGVSDVARPTIPVIFNTGNFYFAKTTLQFSSCRLGSSRSDSSGHATKLPSKLSARTSRGVTEPLTDIENHR